MIDRICVALENYAQHKMLTEGRRYWPENPFETLATISFDYDKDKKDMGQEVEKRQEENKKVSMLILG